MSETRAALVSVTIGRFKGLRDGFTLGDLAPGLNVVHGPNGCGKTTTAEAIGALLWADAGVAPATELAAEVALADGRWRLRREGRVLHAECDGVVREFPLGDPDARARHRLALHELLRDDQADAGAMARAIANELAGGYDLEAAATGLGFRPAPAPGLTRTGVARAWQEADRAVQDALVDDRELGAEEASLADLRAEREASRQAEHDAELYRRALDWVAAATPLTAAETALGAFDPRLARLTGHETQALERIATGLAVETEQQRQATADEAAATRTLDQLGLPAEGVPATTRDALARHVAELVRLSQTSERLARELGRAEAELAAAAAHLGATQPTAPAQLDHEALRALDALARRAAPLLAEQRVTQAELGLLPDAPTGDPEPLRAGVRLLGQWLTSGPRLGRSGLVVWLVGAVAAGALAGSGVVLTAWRGQGWLLGVGLGLVLALVLLARGGGRRRDLEQEFARLGLPGPERWSPAGVDARLGSLVQEAVAAEQGRQQAHRRAGLAARADALATEVAAAQDDWQRLGHRLGVPLPEPSIWPAWVHHLVAWHTAAATRGALAAEEQVGASLSRTTLATVNETLTRYGAPGATDAPSAQALAADLDRRAGEQAAATQQAAAAARARQDSAQRAAALHTEREALLAGLDLADEARPEAVVQAWSERLPAWREAEQAARQASLEREALARQVAAHARFAAHPELLAHTDERLRDELDRLEHQAARADDLTERIHRIEERVAQAKQRTTLEAALAAREQAADGLRRLRASEDAAALGDLLVRHLRAVTREQHEPLVLRRARAWLGRLTAGRYELLVEPGDPPLFRARDTRLGAVQGLDELSAGTRVQLLIAARLAFVETKEQGARLPLLLDEALANSDDERAAAVIGAAAEIAADGRQVIAFTAQHDEALRWRAVAAELGAPLAVLDLAALRARRAAEALPMRPLAAPSEPPEPSDDDLATYGARLGVPGLDPWQPVAAVHLWHLVDTPDELHELLRLRLADWGTCAAEAERRGVPAPLRARLAARAAALERVLAAWRVGRGERVDRAALARSGAVSERFLGEVAALAAQLDGDARALVAALRAKGVNNFRQRQVDDLESWLQREHFLDDRDVAQYAQLLSAGLAAADGAAVAAGQIERWLNAIGLFDVQGEEP